MQKITDTLLMARQIHPGQRNSLEVLQKDIIFKVMIVRIMEL